MKSTVVASFIVLFVTMGIARSQTVKGPSVPRGLASAGDFLKWDKSAQIYYAVGFANGIAFSPVLTAKENVIDEWWQKCVKDRGAEQLAAIIDKMGRYIWRRMSHSSTPAVLASTSFRERLNPAANRSKAVMNKKICMAETDPQTMQETRTGMG